HQVGARGIGHLQLAPVLRTGALPGRDAEVRGARLRGLDEALPDPVLFLGVVGREQRYAGMRLEALRAERDGVQLFADAARERHRGRRLIDPETVALGPE